MGNSSLSKSKSTTPLLHEAVAHQNHVILLGLLQRQKNINITDAKGTTPLHVAVGRNDYDATKYLLRYGADVLRADSCKMTSLHIAVTQGNTEITMLLLQAMTRSWTGLHAIDEVDVWGWTPLHRAVINHNFAVAKILIKHGCHVNIPDDNKRVPLHVAASYGNLSMVRCLLDSYANINQQDIRGRTALYLAVVGQHKHVIQELMQRGCDPSIETVVGYTALSLASIKGFHECLMVLIRLGAPITGFCEDTSSALSLRGDLLEQVLLKSIHPLTTERKVFITIAKELIMASGIIPSSYCIEIIRKGLLRFPSTELLQTLRLVLLSGTKPPEQLAASPHRSNTDERIAGDVLISQYSGQRISCLSLQFIAIRKIRQLLSKPLNNIAYALDSMTGIPPNLKSIILMKTM